MDDRLVRVWMALEEIESPAYLEKLSGTLGRTGGKLSRKVPADGHYLRRATKGPGGDFNHG